MSTKRLPFEKLRFPRKAVNGFIWALCVCLLALNLYYFFIRRGVGPGYYVTRLCAKPVDRIVNKQLYLDYVEEYAELNKRYHGKDVIVFVGDSLTRRFKLGEYFSRTDILNRGIFSDTTWGLMNRLEENVNNLKVCQLFVMIGFNDLQYRSNEEIAQNIKAFLAKVKADKIIVQSLLPVAAGDRDTNGRIVVINARLEALCRECGYCYLDIHEHLVADNGAIKSYFTRDGVHLSAHGYEVWARLLIPLLDVAQQKDSL